MQKLSLSLPGMYADHHVLRVRDVLASTKGIRGVMASAARKEVAVDYDETSITPQQIISQLVAAGYAPDQDLALPILPKSTADGSPWYTVLRRVTQTEIKDREMSGDFRRY